MKIRGFEKIAKYAEVDFPLPERKTELSAGYDFCLPEEVMIALPSGVISTLSCFGSTSTLPRLSMTPQWRGISSMRKLITHP